MDIRCRPIRVSDFGIVECGHWESARQVQEYVNAQGLASMLAFAGAEFLGQLYLKAYDPLFRDPGGWYGHRPWADLGAAQPLYLEGRSLTLGCYHVRPEFRGQGVGKALLRAVVEWQKRQTAFDGLLTWALQPGSKTLLAEAGQLPHTVYHRFGFQEVRQVRDPVWMERVTKERYPDATEEEPGLLRVMVRMRDQGHA